MLERAEAANAAKTEFLRTVSHELRQPLNAMAGLLQLWELGLRGTLSPQQVDDLERIKRNQQQLATLIEDLLSVARLEAGKLSVTSEPVAIASLLEGLRAAVSLDLDARGIEYSIPTVDTSMVAIADPGRLHQVLVNLLTNAMKATSRGDRVDVTCVAEPDVVRIRVRDNGSGIPSDMLDAIFTPFVQVGRALNQPREGAGLGLAISRGLVETMGGTLGAQSEVGVGSTFTVTIPRAPA
ncbi:MAG: HAMP domain-containing sensor histidine kinase [bacterium]